MTRWCWSSRGSCKTPEVDTEVDPPANKQIYFVGYRRGRLPPTPRQLRRGTPSCPYEWEVLQEPV